MRSPNVSPHHIPAREGVSGDIALPVALKRHPYFLPSLFMFVNGDKLSNLSESLTLAKYLKIAKCLEMFVETEVNTASKIMDINNFLAHSRLMMSGLITTL